MLLTTGKIITQKKAQQSHWWQQVRNLHTVTNDWTANLITPCILDVVGKLHKTGLILDADDEEREVQPIQTWIHNIHVNDYRSKHTKLEPDVRVCGPRATAFPENTSWAPAGATDFKPLWEFTVKKYDPMEKS